MVMNISAIENGNDLEFILFNLAFLRNDYPNFYSWYKNIVLPQLSTNERKIYLAKNLSGDFLGSLILKDTPEEKKICTLFVQPGFRGKSLGKQFMEIALNELHFDKPMITVSDLHIDEFSKLLAHYDFYNTERVKNYYTKGGIEYVYNGILYQPVILSA